MRESIDFTSWVAGWTALAFVVGYGVLVIGSVIATARARKAIPVRILVTGSRGKSGTVRLLHAVLSAWQPSYAKITGTAARELFPDGREVETVRIGSTSASEMPHSIRRAAKSGALVGIFECMAISPHLIRLLQHSHVQAKIVAIPAVRLDHLEEEGLSEFEIGKNIIDSIDGCEAIVTGIDQPTLLEYLQKYCTEHGIDLEVVHADKKTPECVGHHPTNVAVALAVAERLGVDRALALQGIANVSLEPRALEFRRLTLADGFQLDLIDLGGANDPQSAWEAIQRTGFDHSPIVPILVNRWERPLRSVSFYASFRGSTPYILVAGTLTRWLGTRHTRAAYRKGSRRRDSQYLGLSLLWAKDPEVLAGQLRSRIKAPHNRIVLVLLENTHEYAADVLRDTFATRGETLTIGKEAMGR